MNKKILSQPKTMEDLVTYWAWKKIDLDRTIGYLRDVSKISEEWNGSIQEAMMERIAQVRLIESLQRRHRHGEF